MSVPLNTIKLPLNWTMHIVQKKTSHPTMILCVEIHPMTKEITIGEHPVTGGNPELMRGVFIRHILEYRRIIGIEPLIDSTEIECELSKIEAGYQTEMLWTGDCLSKWTESARQGADKLMEIILTLIQVEK